MVENLVILLKHNFFSFLQYNSEGPSLVETILSLLNKFQLNSVLHCRVFEILTFLV